MSKRDVISIAAGKVFDSLPNDEKKEVFLDEIEKIESDENFKKIKKYWDNLDEDKKLKYYQDGEIISVIGSVKHSLQPLKPLNIVHMKSDIKERLYEKASPLIRLGVSFGLLDAPKKLEEKELLKNIKKDARRLKRNLGIFEKVCAVVPQLRAAFPIVKAIRPYAKRYEKNGAPLMQERIRNKQLETTEKTTTHKLSASEEDILETKVVEENKID